MASYSPHRSRMNPLSSTPSLRLAYTDFSTAIAGIPIISALAPLMSFAAAARMCSSDSCRYYAGRPILSSFVVVVNTTQRLFPTAWRVRTLAKELGRSPLLDATVVLDIHDSTSNGCPAGIFCVASIHLTFHIQTRPLHALLCLILECILFSLSFSQNSGRRNPQPTTFINPPAHPAFVNHTHSINKFRSIGIHGRKSRSRDCSRGVTSHLGLSDRTPSFSSFTAPPWRSIPHTPFSKSTYAKGRSCEIEVRLGWGGW
ncbi:hypothetical protein QBC36DRAFT_21744 [Triangularia setosa]|uniref:Uncharacterized protein n=1 Tax=Triangularia setosa TaxID=2587417 RepID=A0AAN7A6Z8_9PEZI|nr:hypothetical protein QBC36DRAFT_21744 [Podospora setosa]